MTDQYNPSPSELNGEPDLVPVNHVPLWVKGLVLCGVILFLIQIPSFSSSLNDAVQKKRADQAFNEGRYQQSIELYAGLSENYSQDKDLIKKMGFAYYRGGQYLEALTAFDQLTGTTMTEDDIEEINAAVDDMAAKLNLQSE